MEHSPYDLGRVFKEFGPSLSNIVAGFILSCLFSSGGLFLIIIPWRLDYGNHGTDWLVVGVGTLIGLVLLAAAVRFFVFARRLMDRNLKVHEHGLQVHWDGCLTNVRWDRIETITEILISQQVRGAGALGSLMPPICCKRYRITMKGKSDELLFDPNSIKKIAELGRVLRAIAYSHAIPFVTDKVYADWGAISHTT